MSNKLSISSPSHILRFAKAVTSSLLVCGAITACAVGGGESDDASDPSSPAGASTAKEADTSPNPSWLVGTWSYGGKIENNIAFTSEDRAIELKATTYRYKYGKDWLKDESGTWRLEAGRLVLTGGYLKSKTFELATAMTKNCRILETDSIKLSRVGVVEGCPFANPPLTKSERCVAGKYTKNNGSSTSTGSVSSSDSVTITLDRDRFYQRDSSSSSSRCYGSTCKSLFNSPIPAVGTWALEGDVLQGATVTLAELRSGFDFVPADPSCPGATAGAGTPGGFDAGAAYDAGGRPAFDAGQ